MADNKKDKKEKPAVKTAVFSKEQFLKADLYRPHRDILNAVLEDDKKYSKEQVNKMISKFIGKDGK